MTKEDRPKVALITSNFWPERTGIGQVTTEFAQYLSGEGIDVTVATALPYYPEWKIYPEYRGMLGMTEKLGDITIHRAWHLIRPAPRLANRLAHELSLCSFAVPQIARALRGADAAYIFSPDLSLAFTASVIARAVNVWHALVIQDVMPDAAIELGMLTNPRAIQLSKWMAREMYDAADEIFTLGEGMRKKIERDTRRHEKISILRNTVNAAELAPGNGQGKPFRERFVPDDTFAVVHAGNMGKKQDLDLLLRTAQRLQSRSDIRFYVFGDGAVKDEFMRQRAASGLANVEIFPFQPREMVPHMLFGADVVLVSQLPEVIDTVVPLKLITAMAAGAMIVAACAPESDTAKLVNASGGGMTIPASDDGALSRALLAIKNGEIDTTRYRTAAREYATAHFDRHATYGPHAAAIRSRSRIRQHG
jgi:colanic acid biosynthesis glycosyl transferase WcaI